MERRFYVYEWYIVETNEVFYVGKGTKNRKTEISNRSKYFKSVYEKYDCDVRIYKDGLTNQESLDLEVERIAELRKNGQAKCNFTEGGTGFSTGWLNPTYHRSNRGKNNGFYGHTHTEDAKRRISESRKGKGGQVGKDNPMYNDHRFSGENNPMYGVTGFDNPNAYKYEIDGEYYTYKQAEKKFGIAFSRVYSNGGLLHYKKQCKNKDLYEGLEVKRIF